MMKIVKLDIDRDGNLVGWWLKMRMDGGTNFWISEFWYEMSGAGAPSELKSESDSFA